MATWITHLMIADTLLERFPSLDPRSFCVGNIAPDCNVENEDWTSFSPSREVTHWMQGARKQASDCSAFCKQYISDRNPRPVAEELAFLLGYYVHLITDAEFQRMIRDPDRVSAAWNRICSAPLLMQKCAGLDATWDNIKKLIPKNQRIAGINTLEAEYLAAHPDSGYWKHILPLKEFPDYIDYLPRGAIPRKIGIMGYIPTRDPGGDFLAMSREEYAAFVENAVSLCIPAIEAILSQPQTVTEVVAALIWDGDKFLACQRPAHKARGLLWEFVGGKVEPGESKKAALIRECREELAIHIAVGDVFTEVLHEYPDLTVRLTLFHATITEGAPQKLEHNDLRWITPAQIPELEFCPADEEILKRIMEVYA